MAIHRIYIDGTWYLLPIPEKADTLEATGAVNDHKFMTPKKTKELIDSLDLGAISEVVTTGTGNAVTNITVSSDGKTLTATKGSTFSLTNHTHSLSSSGITGVLPISKGGTGATSASTARDALGLGSLALKNSLTPNDIPNLDAGKITTGTLGTARIPNLSTSKITSGEFNRARIREMVCKDTRDVSENPSELNTALKADFKRTSIINLTGEGTYSGVLTIRPYGSTTDFSGGPVHQIALTQNGGLLHRVSTGSSSWGDWKKIVYSGHSHTVSDIVGLGNIATKNLSSDFTWTGKHIFDIGPGNTNSIEFKTSSGKLPKFTATIDAGQEGTYPMEWTMPTASGTLATTSDLTWNKITGKPSLVDTTSNQTIDGVKTFAKKITINYQTAEQIELMSSSGKAALRTSSGQLMMMNSGDSSWVAVLNPNNLGNYIKTVFGKPLVGTSGNIELEVDDVPTLPHTKISGLGSLATKNSSSTFNWTGLHSFSEPIRLTPNTAIYSLGAPTIGSGTVELPYNKSGTIALTSDIPDVVYGYCSTSASTTTKVVSSSTFTSHKAGQIYVIEFVNGNTATSPTININSTGAIGVRHLTTNGAVTTSPGTDIMYSRSRTIWTFVYNGTYLIPIGESTRYWNALETKMLGYSKGSSGSAITTSDTVSSAIGKLEYRLDNSPSGGLELVRDRGHGANLDSVGSGTTSGYVVLDKLVSPGDTLMIEVSKFSGGTYNPKIVTVTVGTSNSLASTTDADYMNSWSYFNGTIMGIYTFTCWAGGSSSSSLYFGAKRYIQGSFSGTTINWTTSTYTLYVGRVWRVNR